MTGMMAKIGNERRGFDRRHLGKYGMVRLIAREGPGLVNSIQHTS